MFCFGFGFSPLVLFFGFAGTGGLGVLTEGFGGGEEAAGEDDWTRFVSLILFFLFLFFQYK